MIRQLSEFRVQWAEQASKLASLVRQSMLGLFEKLENFSRSKYIKTPVIRALFVVVFMLVLSGCFRSSLEKLERKDIEGENFYQVLAREYKAYADEQRKNFDWPDSELFAKKGLRAAGGVTVDPEHPEEWDIPGNLLPTFQVARRELLDTIDSLAIEQFPKQAGRVYFLYDCWLERQEENWVDEHVEPCQNEFYETLNRINLMKEDYKNRQIELARAKLAELEAEQKKDEKAEEVTIAEPEEEMMEVAEEPEEEMKPKITGESFIMFFEFGSFDISAEGHQIIGKVLATVNGMENYEIILNGHTDRAGLEGFNLSLSKRRAAKVADELVAAGADSSKIKQFGFGESDPIRQTEDGVRDPVNRRVEIIIR